MIVRIAARWVVEQWCHAFPIEVEGPVQIAEVVVPVAEIEAVIAEAEVLCAAAAIVEAVAA